MLYFVARESWKISWFFYAKINHKNIFEKKPQNSLFWHDRSVNQC